MSKLKSLKAVKEEEADGCECCIQWTLLFANIPVLLIGVVLITLGVWTLTERSYIGELQSQNGSIYKGITISIIIAGVFLMLLSVFGFLAAFIENKTVIISYYGCVLLVFVLLCVCILLGFIYRMKVAEVLRSELRSSVVDYDDRQPEAPVTMAWDKLQRELKCCGVGTASDDTVPYRVWQENRIINSGEADFTVPESCCVESTSTGQTADCREFGSVQTDRIYQTDCFDSAAEFVTDHIIVLGICSLVFAIALIAAASLSICLFFLAD